MGTFRSRDKLSEISSQLLELERKVQNSIRANPEPDIEAAGSYLSNQNRLLKRLQNSEKNHHLELDPSSDKIKKFIIMRKKTADLIKARMGVLQQQLSSLESSVLLLQHYLPGGEKNAPPASLRIDANA